MTKFKFNIEPITIEAKNELEAWKLFEEVDWIFDCKTMEELE